MGHYDSARESDYEQAKKRQDQIDAQLEEQGHRRNPVTGKMMSPYEMDKWCAFLDVLLKHKLSRHFNKD